METVPDPREFPAPTHESAKAKPGLDLQEAQRCGQATIVARQMHEGLYKMKASTGIYRNIWDYIADAPPGTSAAPAASPDFSATMAAIAVARAAGDLDEVKRLKAEFAASRAQG